MGAHLLWSGSSFLCQPFSPVVWVDSPTLEIISLEGVIEAVYSVPDLVSLGQRDWHPQALKWGILILQSLERKDP